MAYVEAYPDVLEPELSSDMSDTLPSFADTTQDFYPNKDKAFEKIHEHSIWRDTVEIGTKPETAREYSTVVALPKSQLVDTPIVMTSAYLTSTHGHNEHTMLHLLDLGFPVIMVGPEGEAKTNKSLLTQIQNAKNSSLPLSTHNAMEALDALSMVHNGQSFQTFDDKNIIVLGESRGAMIGVGLPAYGVEHGRNVIYADLTAPCFPERFDYSPSGIFNMVKQGLAESNALRGLARTLTERRFLHYPSTINPNPRYWIQAGGAIPDLLSGDAGKMAEFSAKLAYVPMHIKGFDDDAMCQFDKWKNILSNHPEVAFKSVDGAHLSIAAPETLQHIERRLMTLRDEIIKHSGDTSKIDFYKVHLTDRDNLGSLGPNLTIVK